MSLTTGSRLGPHEIIGLLGAGGMGEVYLAQDTKLNRRVAIKVLPEAYASDPERISRFHREAQAVAALNHPAIAGIYDLAEADGKNFLILELIEGETLADRIKRGPVPVEEALGISKQILEALEVAHEKGICHRDLKPANVKLTPAGDVKVLDFGLAKFLEPAAIAGNLSHSPTLSLAATYPGRIIGTAGYMSPEQAKGLEADQRSDIFSFGCILFELLSGRQAFEGDTASEILASVLKSEVDFALLPPRLNPRLVELLRRCLEKNPKKRYHAAADVRVEIDTLLGRGTFVEEPQAIAATARPLWKRALSATACVLLGGLLAGYAAWTLKPEPARQVTRFTVRLPDGQQFTNPGRAVVALSPDGTNLVYVANTRLHLRPLAGLEPRVIAGTETGQGILGPVFSPDGQSLAFWSAADRALKRVAITGGAAVTICPTDALFGLNWNEQGIVFGHGSKGILRVSDNGGTPEVMAGVSSDQTAGFPQLLPEGRGLLFNLKSASAGWDASEIVVQSPAGERKTLIKLGAEPRYLPTGHLVYVVQGVLLGVPFDLDRLEVTGGAVPLVEGVRRGAGTAQFAYSSTGSLAYVPGPVTTGVAGATDLALFDRKGGVQPLKLPPGPYRAPRVSPDGKLIAFESEDESEANIFVYQLAGGTAMQRLTFGGKNRAPVWSPDGQWIAFQSDREGDLAIFRQRADGTGTAERLTKPESGISHAPQSSSPDGAHLLFSAQRANDPPTLWVMTTKDKRTTAFGNVKAREAAFSPDGRWVAYQGVPEGGSLSVFVEPFPPTGAKYQLPRPGGHPFWSPKGDEITINTSPVTSHAVTVTTTPRFGFGTPVVIARPGRIEPNPLTGRRNVDMMPDGEHVIGVMSGTVTDNLNPEIRIVLNWFDEVRQRISQ